MIAGKFATLSDRNRAAAEELKTTLAEEGIQRTDGWIAIVAEAENFEVIYDIQEQRRIHIVRSWQPFVNFWMDMMWNLKQQRNYVKLAMVMRSITEREWGSAPDMGDPDHWFDVAKYYQQRYFDGITAILIAVTLTALLAFPATAHAAPNDATLIYLGTEVLDQNGVPTLNNIYTVDCQGQQLTVTIAITFTDGAVARLTSDDYCGAKIYIQGAIELIAIVAVASPPDAIKLVYLPVLSR